MGTENQVWSQKSEEGSGSLERNQALDSTPMKHRL